MPDIPLLRPAVLRGVVEKFTPADSLVMLNKLPKNPWPFPTAQWDVIAGSRAVASPNVPNAEAHIVPRLGRSQGNASFIYLREKKVFEPTTLHWIRTPGETAATNAEKAVMREVGDLNQRFDNFAEWACWRALTGTLTINTPHVQATVDYQFPATHKPTVGTSWASATPQQIVADIRAWKRLVSRDGRVPASTVYTSEVTIQRVFDSFATTGDDLVNFFGGTLLSDRMKDEYYRTGALPGFMGLDWTVVEGIYNSTDSGYEELPPTGEETMFVPDDALFMGNFTANTPIEILEGPTADDEAPEGFTGKFSKTWKDKDPSARQFLLEWNFLPVITRPEQFIYVADVAP